MSDTDVDFRKLLEPDKGTTCASAKRHSLMGTQGDLNIELHYGDFGTGAGREAALYLWRLRIGSAEGVYVPLSCLWMYVEGQGTTFRDSWEVMIPPLCERLYGIITRSGLMAVMDAIIDYLDDLRKSPPDMAVFEDYSLQSFLAECSKEELRFSYEIGGKRRYLN